MKWEGYKKGLPLVLVLLALMAFMLIRPTASDSGLVRSSKTLAQQYSEHIGNSMPIHGIDVSHHQGDIYWEKLMYTDVRFVYVKATDGITYLDPNFDSNMTSLSQQRRLRYGAYHLFEAEDDPIMQAENFLTRLSHYSFTLSPMVDVKIKKDQSASVIKARLKTFLDKVQSATSCSPIIYSDKSFWESDIGPSFNDYVFWLADYAQTMDPPAQVKRLELWQYSQKGQVTGVPTPVGLDVLINGNEGLKAISCDAVAKQ